MKIIMTVIILSIVMVIMRFIKIGMELNRISVRWEGKENELWMINLNMNSFI